MMWRQRLDRAGIHLMQDRKKNDFKCSPQLFSLTEKQETTLLLHSHRSFHPPKVLRTSGVWQQKTVGHLPQRPFYLLPLLLSTQCCFLTYRLGKPPIIPMFPTRNRCVSAYIMYRWFEGRDMKGGIDSCWHTLHVYLGLTIFFRTVRY